MHVQSCCFANINRLFFVTFSLPLLSSSLISSPLLWSRNHATMVTWRQTYPLCWMSFCDIWSSQSRVKCYQPSQRLRLIVITLTKTLIMRIWCKLNLNVLSYILLKKKQQQNTALHRTTLFAVVGNHAKKSKLNLQICQLSATRLLTNLWVMLISKISCRLLANEGQIVSAMYNISYLIIIITIFFILQNFFLQYNVHTSILSRFIVWHELTHVILLKDARSQSFTCELFIAERSFFFINLKTPLNSGTMTIAPFIRGK